MDPRTAAKVTAPDLLQAFSEGTGQPDTDTPVVTVWVIYTDGDDVVRMETYGLPALSEALVVVGKHLRSGVGKGALVFTGTEEPAIVDDARRALSDGSGD